MICSQCGHQVDGNMKFCANCGNPMSAPEPAPADLGETTLLNETSVEPVVAEHVAPVAPAEPQYQPPQSAYQPAPQPVYQQQPTYQQPQPTYQQYQQPQSTYQQYQQPQPQYQYVQPVQPTEEPSAGAGKPLGIIGMVLGILSLFFEIFTIGYVTDSPRDEETWTTTLVLSLIFAIVGLVLSIVGKSIASHRGCSNGPAKAGIICSAIGLGFWIVTLIATISIYDSYYYSYYDYYW